MSFANKLYCLIEHKFKSINRHGAHSPFLFDLFNEVIDVPFAKSDLEALENYRRLLISDHHQILFEEHGAGNNQNRTMTVSEITHRSAIDRSEAKLLVNLCKHLAPKTVLELGTSTGVSAHVMNIGAPNAQITTVEGCGELANYIKQNYSHPRIDVIHATFDQFFESEIDNDIKYDLVYIDGNHTFDATLRYCEIIKNRHIHPNTCVIFDDIYWSKGMTDAWKKIVKDASNTLTLDFFKMGIVFFDHKLSKQHFRINI